MQWSKFITIIAGVLFTAAPALLRSQENLIVNGDCDSITECPASVTQINLCLGWNNWSTVGSTDLMNGCSTGSVSVPQSAFGYQFPESGEGYIHSAIFSVSHSNTGSIFRYYATANGKREYRESILGTLSAPLQVGWYRFQCYVNLGSIGDSGNGVVAIDAFDLTFMDTLTSPETSTLPYIDTATIISLNPTGNIVTDTANWVLMEVCYHSKGGEQYFAVGCFRDSMKIQNLEFTGTPNPGNNIYFANYFFDSFSLIACDTCCGRKPEESVVIAGNGTSDSPSFQMTLQNGSEADLTLYDCLGKLILYHRFTYGEEPFELPDSLARAMYHYVIRTTAGFSQAGKVLKQ